MSPRYPKPPRNQSPRHDPSDTWAPQPAGGGGRHHRHGFLAVPAADAVAQGSSESLLRDCDLSGAAWGVHWRIDPDPAAHVVAQAARARLGIVSGELSGAGFSQRGTA